MRRFAAMLAPVLLLALVVLSGYGSGASFADTRSDRDQVRAEKAKVAGNIDTLRANQDQLEAALAVLQDNVDAEEGHLQEAQRAVDEAQTQIETAEKGIAATSRQLTSVRKAMTEFAVDAYIQPEGSALSSLLQATDASEAAQRQALRSLKSDRDADLADRIRGLKAGLQSQRVAAATAKRRAAAKRAEVKVRVDKVDAARAAQQKVVDGVQERIDGQLARAIELGKQDKALSAKLALQQAALQARLAAAQLAQSQAAHAQALADAQASGSYGSGGSESNGPVAGPGATSSAGSSGSVSLCTVGGITVNCQIEGSLSSMMSAAAADGVSLSGGGWRDPSQQIALRQEHCGSSSYAIYQMSPSACSPPTARPGQSMHEVGLAIDFSNCGRGSAAYNWLRGHAGSYGFYNLPSESWHWSVNGN